MEFWKTGRNNIRVTRFLTAAVLPLFLEAESQSFCRSGPPATAISLDSRNVMIETRMCAGDPLKEEAGGGWEGNPGGTEQQDPTTCYPLGGCRWRSGTYRTLLALRHPKKSAPVAPNLDLKSGPE